MTSPPRLTLDDILDLRAYERVRDDYRRRVMARKRLRRVAVGPIMTLVFECADTVRFQVQEMARVERIATDEGIEEELEVYNKLLPAPGELSATLFIELTSDEDLRRWLPQLVGIERAVVIEHEGAGSDAAPATSPGTPAAEPAPASNGAASVGMAVRSVPEATHAESLTREAVTPAVHYLRFPFSASEVAAFAAGPVAVAVRHPAYQHRTVLAEATRQELLSDLEGRTEPLPIDDRS